MATVLLCIPSISVVLALVAWIFIRDGVHFDRFPVKIYKLLLEFVVFFLPAFVLGWYSADIAQVILAGEGSRLTIFTVIGMLAVFVVMGLLELMIGVKKAPKGMEDHDLIAVGAGYPSGLGVNAFRIIALHEQPPRYIYSIIENFENIALFSCLGIIGMGIIVWVYGILMDAPRRRRMLMRVKSKAKRTHRNEPESVVPETDQEPPDSGSVQADPGSDTAR